MGPSPSDLADGRPSPTIASAVNRRPRLEAALDQVPPAGIGVVVAPAGSGKSVLLGQWAKRSAAPVCQMRVTASHDDPVLFARSLVSALAAAAPGFDRALAGLAAGRALGPAFMTRLREELEGLEHDMVIVLDDVHLLGNESIRSDLTSLLGRLPRTVRVLIGARWDPPLRLQRLRLDGRLVELRASDLAFTVDESREVLEQVSGRSLTMPQVHALHARTEGWAAGLQLAGISLQRIPDADSFIDHFTGSERLIADYLAEEVLDDLEPDVRRFLLRTSVLEWLDADLCDAVTGDGNGAAMLDLLASRSLFLVRPDAADERLRYHHLFADLLRYRLRVEPGEEQRARLRAGQWLLDHDHFADSVEQFLAAGEPLRVADLVVARGQESFERGEAATLARWLEAARRMDPSLPAAVEVNLLAAQIAAFKTGDAVETYRRLRRRTDLSPGVSAAASALYACAGLDDLPTAEVFKAAATATGLLRDNADDIVIDFLGVGGRDSAEFLAECMMAIALLHDGELDRSATQFEAVCDLPGAQYRVWKIYALGGLALARALAGRTSEALSDAAAAFDIAEASGMAHHHTLAFAHFARARVALDRLDRDAADLHLRESGIRVRTTRRTAAMALQHLLEVDQAALWQGPAAALADLRSSPHVAREPKLVTELRQAQELHLLIALGRVDQARGLLDHSAPTDALTPHIIDLELASGDLAAARHALSRWQPGTLRSTIEHLVRTAAVLAESGARRRAGIVLQRALDLAEPESLRAPFVAQAEVMRMLRREVSRGSQHFARSIVSAGLDAGDRARRQEATLTEREREVLDYLPTRLTNSEIADTLFVSTNTLKTHLRHLYTKLAAADRDEAVAKAADLGLL